MESVLLTPAQMSDFEYFGSGLETLATSHRFAVLDFRRDQYQGGAKSHYRAPSRRGGCFTKSILLGVQKGSGTIGGNPSVAMRFVQRS